MRRLRLDSCLAVGLLLGCAHAETPGRFVDLDVSYTHACALDRVGAIWCWGEGPAWETGLRPGEDPQRASRIDPAKVGLADERVRTIAAGIDRTCAVRDDGWASCWLGRRTMKPQGELLELFGTGSGEFAELRIADFEIVALDGFGGLERWDTLDDDERGRLGMAMLGGGLPPQRIVAFDTICAVDVAGNLSCWDWRRDEHTNRIEFVLAQVGEGLGDIVDLAGPCVVGADGLVRCPDGDLGRSWNEHGTTLAVVPGLEQVVEIERSSASVCVRLRDGGVHCRGDNDRGQLGDGTTRPRTDFHELASIRSARRLRLSGWGCALDRSEVWCWGTPGPSFGGPGPRSPIESHRLELDAARLFASGDSTCVVQRSGTIRCLGIRSAGGMEDHARLRTAHGLDRIVGEIHAMLAIGDELCMVMGEEMRCTGVPLRDRDTLWFGRMQPRPAHTQNGPRPRTIEGCSIDEHERVRCNYAGLEYEPPAAQVVELVAGHVHHCARERGGDVVCWGPNYRGEIGKLPARARLRPSPVDFPD
jgi:alpha-tubulin suppressor-like RCC1 family protein